METDSKFMILMFIGSFILIGFTTYIRHQADKALVNHTINRTKTIAVEWLK